MKEIFDFGFRILDFMRHHANRAVLFALAVSAYPTVAAAGMPGITLSDAARLRLNSISFFVVGFLVCAAAVKGLWNYVAQDFPRFPRLTYGKSVAIVFLWGVLFILVLTMISGARELMTPGAWEKQGWTYKLAAERSQKPDAGVDSRILALRQAHLVELHAALSQFANQHDGHFPESPAAPGVAAELWQLPNRLGLDYLYVSGRTIALPDSVLAYEPDVYDDFRCVLFASGRVTRMRTVELRYELAKGSEP